MAEGLICSAGRPPAQGVEDECADCIAQEGALGDEGEVVCRVGREQVVEDSDRHGAGLTAATRTQGPNFPRGGICVSIGCQPAPFLPPALVRPPCQPQCEFANPRPVTFHLTAKYTSGIASFLCESHLML